jgi:hypothetical protein
LSTEYCKSGNELQDCYRRTTRLSAPSIYLLLQLGGIVNGNSDRRETTDAEEEDENHENEMEKNRKHL